MRSSTSRRAGPPLNFRDADDYKILFMRRTMTFSRVFISFNPVFNSSLVIVPARSRLSSRAVSVCARRESLRTVLAFRRLPNPPLAFLDVMMEFLVFHMNRAELAG
jgi:hypothetical protein